MFQFIFQNWLLLIPILGLSVLALFLIFERGFFYLKIKEPEKAFEKRVILDLRKGLLKNVVDELKQKSSPQAHVILEGLRWRGAGKKELERRMESAAMEWMYKMEKNVSYLSGIANIATLLGLFGTVTGMIVAFTNMNFFGISDPSVLAGGISQALVTTAAGLGVAIPALLFHSIFTQFIGSTASRLELAARELLILFPDK